MDDNEQARGTSNIGDGHPSPQPSGPAKDHVRVRRLVLATIVVLIIMVGVIWALLEVSSSPRFYARFPWLREYVASWKASSHKDVPCASCHFVPGARGAVRAERLGVALVAEQVTGTGNTAAFRSFPSAGCTQKGCHPNMIDDGEVDWHGVRFSHSDHLGKIKRGLKPACTTCHQSLVHGGTKPVNTEACSICHFKNLGWEEDISRCRLCHDMAKLGKGRYDHTEVIAKNMSCAGCHADINVGVGDVDHERCVTCHTAGNRAAKFEDVKLIHSTHVDGQGFPCTFCHHPIEHRVHALAISSNTDCTACHRGAHQSTRSLYLGFSTGAPGGAAVPDFMAKAHVHCQGCHTSMRPARDGEVARPNAQACNDCHGPGYNRILRQWSKLLRRDLAAARTAVGAARTAARGRRLPKTAREALASARSRLRQVEVGHGEHNVVFAAVQLDAAVAAANTVLEAAGTGRSFPRIADAERLTANECARCHPEIPATVRYRGAAFPHAKHIESVGDCESCHTPYSDHGKLSWGKQACSTCHGDVPVPHPANFRAQMGRIVKKTGFDACLQCHDTEAAQERCTPCHQGGPAKEINWKGMPLSHANHAKHDIDCTSCHTELKAHGGVALSPDECNDCHGLKMPHTDDFAETHGHLFEEHKLDLVTCSTCHEGGMPGEFCQACHG